MSNRRTNFELDKALQRITNPSIFDTFIKEIDIECVPPEYIDRVVVYYSNGSIIELPSKYITSPVPLDLNSKWAKSKEVSESMQEIKVFVDTDKLERDVNILLDKLLSKYFP